MIRPRLLPAVVALVAPAAAGAHQLVVFASVDCEAVLVEAKFSSGRVPVEGEVRVLDGERVPLTTLLLEADGTSLTAATAAVAVAVTLGGSQCTGQAAGRRGELSIAVFRATVAE